MPAQKKDKADEIPLPNPTTRQPPPDNTPPEVNDVVTIQRGERIRQCAKVDIKAFEAMGYAAVKAAK